MQQLQTDYADLYTHEVIVLQFAYDAKVFK